MGTSPQSQSCLYPDPRKPRGVCGLPLSGRGRWRWCVIHAEQIVADRDALYSWAYRLRQTRREFVTSLLAAATAIADGLQDVPKSEQRARLAARFMELRTRAATGKLSPDLRNDVLALRDVLARLGVDRELFLRTEELAINLGNRDPYRLDQRACRLAQILGAEGELFRAGLMYLTAINIARHSQRSEDWFTERVRKFDGFFAAHQDHLPPEERAHLLHQRKRFELMWRADHRAKPLVADFDTLAGIAEESKCWVLVFETKLDHAGFLLPGAERALADANSAFCKLERGELEPALRRRRHLLERKLLAAQVCWKRPAQAVDLIQRYVENVNVVGEGNRYEYRRVRTWQLRVNERLPEVRDVGCWLPGSVPWFVVME